MKKLLYILIFLLCCLPSSSWAVTKTVCASGCDYTTIAGAFAYNFAPGDILEIQADTPGGSKTYSETINPGADDVGDVSNQFTIQGRSGDTVTIANASTLLDLSGGQDYITVKNIHFGTFTSRWANLTGNTGFVGEDLTFDSVPATGGSYGYFYINGAENHTYTNCSWDGSDQTEDTQHNGIDVSYLTASTKLLFDGCTFLHFAHSSFYCNWNTSYVTFKDCTFYNKWRTPLTLQGSHMLVEDSTFYTNGKNNSTDPYVAGRNKLSAAIYFLRSNHAIVRRNKIYDSDVGFFFGTLNDSWYVTLVRFYSNTIYDINKYGTNSSCGVLMYGEPGSGITGEGMNYNYIKNNIFSEIQGDDAGKEFNVHDTGWDISNNDVSYNMFYNAAGAMNGTWDTTSDSITAIETAESEWHDNTETAPLMTDPSNQDFTLQSNSPAIDAATHLTEVHASDTGSGNTLIVKDAEYFYDGWGISGETGDYICIGSSTTPRLITAINYSTNTMTVTDADDRSVNDEVWLAYSSTECWKGSGPDIGAEEYNSAAPTGNALTISDINGPGAVTVSNINGTGAITPSF